MGQFGNQPDFATTSVRAITPSDVIDSTTKLDGAIIYIGDNVTTGDHMKVIVAGVRAAGGGVPTAAEAVTFKGLQAGGFLPVTVDYVLATGTTVGELIAAK